MVSLGFKGKTRIRKMADKHKKTNPPALFPFYFLVHSQI